MSSLCRTSGKRCAELVRDRLELHAWMVDCVGCLVPTVEKALARDTGASALGRCVHPSSVPDGQVSSSPHDCDQGGGWEGDQAGGLAELAQPDTRLRAQLIKLVLVEHVPQGPRVDIGGDPRVN